MAAPVAAALAAVLLAAGPSATPAATGSPSPAHGATAGCGTAPALAAGTYTDSLAPGRTASYRFSVAPGAAARAVAVAVPPGGITSRASLTLTIRQGQRPLAVGATDALGWGDAVTAGATTARLGWDRLPAGGSVVPLCVQLRGDVAGPVELTLASVGSPLATPKPAPSASGSQDGIAAPPRSSSPDPALIAALAAVGLLGGAAVRVAVWRRARPDRTGGEAP
ncbi:hypothetical protein BIV57_01895 [Mangrovactinospora gilvigrisea]|uniref:Uncharacterized protein n=1 Tax=Mangrovactinospora gilvigrisea TaxID=1428644 RepID=A0A1J7BL06_9ACTN|nr:hypothetical protein [Mangrovactinospora gilvigrisea]OIV39261.1 hypothetical protein BIV57_01895 [Mangrovactinospora gilvigrisea]